MRYIRQHTVGRRAAGGAPCIVWGIAIGVDRRTTSSPGCANPSYIGAGQLRADYIQLSRGDATEPFAGRRLRCLRWKHRTGELREQSVEPPVIARLTGHGTRAATFQAILRWEKRDRQDWPYGNAPAMRTHSLVSIPFVLLSRKTRFSRTFLGHKQLRKRSRRRKWATAWRPCRVRHL